MFKMTTSWSQLELLVKTQILNHMSSYGMLNLYVGIYTRILC